MQRRSATQPEIFASRRPWRLRLATFMFDAAANTATDPPHAASACSAIMSPPFLDILDGGSFVRAPCLCCYEARDAAKARSAAISLRLFLRYFNHETWKLSQVAPAASIALASDATPDELRSIAADFASCDGTPSNILRINTQKPGEICIASPACQPGVLWVYSTPASRRMLRHIARQLRRQNPPLALNVEVASSNPAIYPRWRARMYSIRVVGEQSIDHVWRPMQQWLATAT